MAGEYVFQFEGLTKTVGHATLFEDASLAFFFGAHIGIIGPNGAGKSTLLRILAGQDADFTGRVYVAPRLRIGFLEQEPRFEPGQTVGGAVDEGAAAARACLARYDELCGRMADNAPPTAMAAMQRELGQLQDAIDAGELWELDRQIETAMDALRLPPADRPVASLSGGEQRRVALCRLLLSSPDALLLDEPTNHLDAESVEWLEGYLGRYRGTLLVATHDRYFLNNVTEWILEVDRGRLWPFKGNYESWLEQRRGMAEAEVRQQASRQRLLERELAWVRMNAGARHSRNRARLRRYEDMLAQTVDVREEEMQIQIPPGPRLGNLVVRAEAMSFGRGEVLLMDGVTFDLPPAGIVGVIGPNGAGKTTLFHLIAGRLQPTSGSLTVGPTVQIAEVEQFRDSLRPDATVFEEICDGRDTVCLGGREMNGRAYCARFNFRGADQRKRVGELSGGERNRVHLAKLLKVGGNLLLLDEPTNDLDVHTLRSLEEALASFAGCAMVISHDRWFLDRVATHILAFEGDSRVVWFEGTYADYREDRRRRLGEAADRPHRIAFRPLHTGS